MSVRRRRIKERIERERLFKESAAKFDHSMKCMQHAINAAIARGETKITNRTRREMGRRLMLVQPTEKAEKQ